MLKENAIGTKNVDENFVATKNKNLNIYRDHLFN